MTEMVEKPNSGDKSAMRRKESIIEAKWKSCGDPIFWSWDLWDLPAIIYLLSFYT